MQALARVSSDYGSRGLSWTKATGHGIAVRSRDMVLVGSVWAALRGRSIAQLSSTAAANGFSWARTTSRALALRSRDAASIAAARTAETVRVVIWVSLAAAAKSADWARAQAGELAGKLEQGRLAASPWLRAGAEVAGARVSTIGVETKRIAARQMKNAAFLAMRLNAQVKGELDALKRAAHDG